ncbi:MAG TPA: tRNA pseudouridine(55) synthase, partial [Cyclobacteriaceae bacterium]|nr:tRNA pseudouridine(55) synthase [Cyclobacteriaceae bacterium]
HSAIKIDGKRAYKFARQGKEIELKPREVEVIEFEITSIALPNINFRIVCSKGTYIRSLARDLGEKLGVGAYLSQLCRTRIGNFKLEDSVSIDDVTPPHADLLQH